MATTPVTFVERVRDGKAGQERIAQGVHVDDLPAWPRVVSGDSDRAPYLDLRGVVLLAKREARTDVVVPRYRVCRVTPHEARDVGPVEGGVGNLGFVVLYFGEAQRGEAAHPGQKDTRARHGDREPRRLERLPSAR